MTKRAEKENPVIGYHVANGQYAVINRLGTREDPAFGSKERAVAAAERYGRGAEVKEVVALHLAGLLGVIFQDVGDVQLDGLAAKRLVDVCRGQQVKVWPVQIDAVGCRACVGIRCGHLSRRASSANNRLRCQCRTTIEAEREDHGKITSIPRFGAGFVVPFSSCCFPPA